MDAGVSKTRWNLTEKSWQNLLKRLDSDPDRAVAGYESLRGRLITIFRARGCRNPDELADVALDRVARALETEQIDDLFRYAAGVARFVASEHFRSFKGMPISDRFQVPDTGGISNQEHDGVTDRRIECMDACCNRLPVCDRELIVAWYTGRGREKVVSKLTLAERLGVTQVALRVRAFRLRQGLRTCIEGCLQAQPVTKREFLH
jgi:hypothetical protein